MIIESVSSHAAERVEEAIQTSINGLDHSYSLIATERCPNCQYMQSWMIGEERRGEAFVRALFVGAIPAGLVLAWLNLTKGGTFQNTFCIPGIVFLVFAIPAGFIRYYTYRPNQERSATKQNLPKITIRRSKNYMRLPDWEGARFGGAPSTFGVHAAAKVRTIRPGTPGKTGDRSIDNTDNPVSPDVIFKNY